MHSIWILVEFGVHADHIEQELQMKCCHFLHVQKESGAEKMRKRRLNLPL